MMNKNIDEVEFTIFDTETTGLEPKTGDRIVEIAGIRIKGKEKIATFQSLINPGRAISAAAFSVNQITPEILKEAPKAEEVMPRFLDFIRDSCLCSYNAPFDLGFLNNELKLIGKAALERVVVLDILRMARRTLPGLSRYALWFVADKIGLNQEQNHRALADVEITLAVFNKLKEMLQEKGVADFLSFAHLFGVNPEALKDSMNQRIANIQEALDLGVRIKIKYISSSGAISERQVLPKEIHKENNRYYLLAQCLLRNEERSFRIDGILHLEIV